MVSTRNVQKQQQYQHHQQQQQQPERNAKLFESGMEKLQLQQSSNFPFKPNPPIPAPIQSPVQQIHHTTYSSSPSVRPHQRTVQILPSYLINEHLQTAQSQNIYHHQPPPPPPRSAAPSPKAETRTSQQMKTLLDLINGVSGNRGSLGKRKRRKSRRLRKARNNYDESVIYWADRTESKNAHNSLIKSPTISSSSSNKYEPIGSANNNIAYTISSSGKPHLNKTSSSSSSSINSKSSKLNHNASNITNNNSNSNRLNGIHVESSKKFSSQNRPTVIAENVLEAPFATSTSAGQTKTIIISGSRTITTSTDRTAAKASMANAETKSQNTKHRKETLKQRPIKLIEDKNELHHQQQQQQIHTNSSLSAQSRDLDRSKWTNKYNIDYDNKLEDEYEIIMKDE